MKKSIILISILLLCLPVLIYSQQRGYQGTHIGIMADTIKCTGNVSGVQKDTSGVFHFGNSIGNYTLFAKIDSVSNCGSEDPLTMRVEIEVSDSTLNDTLVVSWATNADTTGKANPDSIMGIPLLNIQYYKTVTLPVAKNTRFIVAIDTCAVDSSIYFVRLDLFKQ